jgi:hypothetical protein
MYLAKKTADIHLYNWSEYKISSTSLQLRNLNNIWYLYFCPAFRSDKPRTDKMTGQPGNTIGYTIIANTMLTAIIINSLI